MLLIISPSKTQDFSQIDVTSYSLPALLEHTCQLAENLRKLNIEQIGSLMKTSERLSSSSWQSFQDFKMPLVQGKAKQSIFAFKGDVYSGIMADQYSEEELGFSQEHLRIISGFYGILKPLDLILPYRLEMSTSLVTDRGKDLYKFWGDLLTEEVNRALALSADPVLVNLASQEYFKALLPGKIKGRIINISFKEGKNGKYRTIAIHAKRARGKMVDFVIRNRLEDCGELTGFSADGYLYNQELSSDSDLVFCR